MTRAEVDLATGPDIGFERPVGAGECGRGVADMDLDDKMRRTSGGSLAS